VKVGDLVKVDCASKDVGYLRAVHDGIMDRVGMIVTCNPERLNSCSVYWGTPPSSIAGIAFEHKDGALWMRSEHLTVIE
jgi:hypothetical protein